METVIGFWIVCGVAGAIIASRHNSGVAGFFLGILLGPIGVIAAFALDGRRKCPQCASRMNDGAKVCPQCRSALSAPDPRYAHLERAKTADFAAEQVLSERIKDKHGIPPRRS